MRRFFLSFIFCGFLLFFSAKTFSTNPPQFSDFPAGPAYSGPSTLANLDSPETRQFRSILTKASLEKPNFAAHYILTSWGCGSGCSMNAIIDAKNGKVFMFPFTVTAMATGEQEPVSFKLDSTLVIVKGTRNEALREGTYYYKWEKGQLILLNPPVQKNY